MAADSSQSTVVDYWQAGQSEPSSLGMGIADISGHLAKDWMPSLPAEVNNSFIGWPPVLLDSLGDHRMLVLQPVAGRCERQWKGVLAWMLGVAGTRHVLAAECYLWIAPLSAFDSRKNIDLGTWNKGVFPRRSIKVTRRQGNPSRLRPDYLAMRPVLGSAAGYEWAIVESKGTQRSVERLAQCPDDWYQQVRSVVIQVWGVPQEVSRHLVVATRVNPNAVQGLSRRIQIRAWNSARADPPQPPLDAVVDIAAAHIFGLCHNFHLKHCAYALALAVASWGKSPEWTDRQEPRAEEREVWRRAEDELLRPRLPIETADGIIDVKLAAPVVSLVKELWNAKSLAEAARAIRNAERQLAQERSGPESGVKPESSMDKPRPYLEAAALGVEVRFRQR